LGCRIIFKAAWRIMVTLGGCPKTNMPVSGYQYVVLFNPFKALYIVGELVKR
jgi:hypothetical protein